MQLFDAPGASAVNVSEGLAALPEAEAQAALRPLAPGAFLADEFEVVEVLSRGVVNLYRAATGSYVEPLQALLVERAAAGTAVSSPPESRLFPPRRQFTQDDREYLAFAWQDTTMLTDYRAPLQDVPLLSAVADLAEGLLRVEQEQLRMDCSLELLRFDDAGRLGYYGFLQQAALPATVATAAPEPRRQLAQVTTILLCQVYGTSHTMRLDDAFSSLALSDEVKQLVVKVAAEDDTTTLEAIVAESALLLQPPHDPPDVAMVSDVGLQRDLNEDAALMLSLRRAGQLHDQVLDLWAVADGMGGHDGGEIASDATLNALWGAVAELDPAVLQDNPALRATLVGVLDEVNTAVIEIAGAGRVQNERNRPGSTLVFAVRLGQRLLVGNVGDSRAYKWNPRAGLQRITKDHSYVQSLIDRGALSEEEAWQHPDGSVITAHIGLPGLRQRDVFLRFCSSGDRLLLVSDGVVDMLPETEIEEIIAHGASSRAICDQLVSAANDAGGSDNITAICAIF